MKVAAVTTWPPHSDGVALYSAELYAHIAELVDVKVIANVPEQPYSYNNYCGMERIIVRCWKRGSFTYPLRIFSWVLKERPDIVHLQHGWLLYGNFISSPLILISLFLLRLNRKPCVVTMHTVIRKGACLCENSLVNLLARMVILFTSRFIVRFSDRIIVLNYSMKKVLQEDYALKEGKKIIVIPHGVKDTSKKSVTHSKRRKPRILSLGFIRESKGMETLIKAFEKFLEHYPDAKLVIVGGRHVHDKKDHIGCFKRLVTPNLSKHVVFTDFIDEKRLDRFIMKSDIIVLLSLERYYVETSGALARVAGYGKPVVCSRVPKFETELQNGKDCIMTAPGDSEELSQAFMSLAQDAQLGKNLGEKLREKFKDRCWSTVAKQHFDLYRSILEI
jgi:glycosyltransferase involved in cell wall biosynthesis